MGGDPAIAVERQTRLRATRGEQVVAVALAVYAGGLFALIDQPRVAFGIVMAVVLLGAAVWGNRAAMAIVCFAIVFGPWSAFYVLAAPHIVFAAFLLWRGNRLDNSV